MARFERHLVEIFFMRQGINLMWILDEARRYLAERKNSL